MAASGPNVHVPVAPVRTDHGDTTQGRYVGIGDAFQGKGKGELVIPSLLTLVSRDTDDSPIPFENLLVWVYIFFNLPALKWIGVELN